MSPFPAWIRNRWNDQFSPYRGCTDTEIEEIKRDQRVDHLPQAYEEWLRKRGTLKEGWSSPGASRYPELLEVKKGAQDDLVWAGSFRLPDGAFVIYLVSPYFLFLHSEGEGPSVYQYDAREKLVESWPHFSDLVRDL